eukprot:9497073-Pyramimonas_sp.AAC.1
MALQDVSANWWERVQVVLRKLAQHKRRANGRSQSEALAVAGAKLAGQPPGCACKSAGRSPDATTWTSWLAVLLELRDITYQQLDVYATEAERVAQRGRSHAVSASLADFKDLIGKQEHAGVIFRTTKESPLADVEFPASASSDQDVIFQPKDVVDHKAAHWHALWTSRVKQTVPEVRELFE